jgi:excisionase family DNA binding protein
MAQKYYTVKETAGILNLGEDEVRKMLERRELYGYRDGSEWKFKTEDVDRMAKERQLQTPPQQDETADVLLSEVELGQSEIAATGTVIGRDDAGRNASESGLRLADSGINLAGDVQPTPPVKKESGEESSGRLLDSGIDLAGGPKSTPKKEKVDSKVAQFEDLDLMLDEDVSLADSSVGMHVDGVGSDKGGSQVDLTGQKLADDDLVLGGSDPGSDVTIGGDSGISLVDPSDSGISLEAPPDLAGGDDSLALGEEALVGGESVKTGVRKRLKTDDEFLLTPLEEAIDSEESESGSQVIALDTEGDESATMISGGRSRVNMLDDELVAQPTLDMAPGSPMPIAPTFGAQPRALAEGVPAAHAAALFPEAPYTGLQVTALIVCVLMLMLCGMVIYDLTRNMWSWNGAFSVNSSLMDYVLSLFEK